MLFNMEQIWYQPNGRYIEQPPGLYDYQSWFFFI